MPIYEYKCSECGTRFEKLTSHAQADDVACGECGGKTRRLLSVFGVATKDESPCAGGACPMPAGGAPPCSAGGCPSCAFQ